ncbi:Rubrerythrin [bacterium]|nr:Rubrerythrin [bacterium]
MDLKKYTKKEIILTALKSEIDAEKAYLELAKRVKNFLLADRLKFLAQEEKKHAVFLKELFKGEFPGEQPKVPDESVIVLPEINIKDESISMSELLEQAKAAEDAAATYYSSMISFFSEEDQDQPVDENTRQRLENVRDHLLYLATMEVGHSRMLETEAEHAREKEHQNMEWDMIHVGP